MCPVRTCREASPFVINQGVADSAETQQERVLSAFPVLMGA